MPIAGEKLRRFRLICGATQAEFGSVVGATQSTVSGWEKGRRPVSSTLNLHHVRDRLNRLVAARQFRLAAERLPEMRSITPAYSMIAKRVTRRQIRSIRRVLGASQPDLARALGVGTSTVCAWERGQNRPPLGLNLTILRKKIEASLAEWRRRSERLRARRRRLNDQRAAARRREGQRLRRARLRLGVSQRALATVLDVGLDTLKDWEMGRRVIPPTLDLGSRKSLLKAAQKEEQRRAAENRSAAQRRRWSRLRGASRRRLIATTLKKGWARSWWVGLRPEERSAIGRERFWTWFPQLDRVAQGNVLAAIRHTTGRRTSTTGRAPAEGVSRRKFKLKGE